MVILEHEYQVDNPENKQKRYVFIPTWEQYKEYFTEKMFGRHFNILEESESLGELKVEFKIDGDPKERTFIHQSIVKEYPIEDVRE